MSEILSKIDVNNYSLQNMVAGSGGGKEEDLTIELGAQDTALSTQQTRIDELESALNNKIALDLADATSDANAVASDIAQGKTAYVDGVKLVGTASIGGYILPDGATFYASKIGTSLPAGIDTSELTTMKSMFAGGVNYTNLDLSEWDTSNVTNMSNMFSQASQLVSIDMSNINTTKVTTMSRMFYQCNTLETVDISNIDTSNVTDFSSMFYQCKKIQNINSILNNIDTKNATALNSMFSACENITELDLSNWNTSKNTNLSYMFSGCTNLVDINVDTLSATITGFDASKLQNIFLNCTSLSNNSLNSILKMCYNITAYSGKTLKNIGLTQEQAQICTTLSNWELATSKNWATGY